MIILNKDEHKLDISNLDLDMEVLTKISQETALKLCILPFNIIGNKVCILAANNLKESTLEYIKFIYKKDLQIYICERKEIVTCISKYHKKIALYGAMKELENDYTQDKLIQLSSENYLDIKNAPAVKITNLIINEAIVMKASDIHIEPFQNNVLIRFRIDGILIDYTRISKKVYNFLLSRIKIMANMDISKKFIPSDGKIHYEQNQRKFDLRVSTLPTIYGEKIVIRILDKNQGNISLDNLGFRSESCNLIKTCIKKPNGMILVVGPTGSGKSTTLYGVLNQLNKKENNITTIEDPVEYNMPYVNQVNINNKSGLTFAGGLRSILRQDPDIIMIGEIRDSETAKIAVKAAMTGHLVFSTLHTKDFVGTVLRLMDMGVENYLLGDTLIAIISQRLVRKICTNCRESYIPSEEEKRILNLDDGEILFKGKGCEKCNKTGYYSRTVLYEITTIGEQEKNFIRNINSMENINYKKENKLRYSLKQNAIELVKKGITTYDEIIKYII